MKPLARHAPLAAALAVLFAAVAALGQAALRAADGHVVYALDDTYIQMALAKNLAAHGVWGVTQDAFSGAGSSLLWPPLLAAIDLVAGRGERAPFVLNVLAAAVLLAIAAGVLRRHVPSRWIQTLTLALLVVAVPLAVLPLVGMEHALQAVAALTLAVTGVRSCVATGDREGRRLFAWASLAALCAVAVRYDTAAVLVALIVVTAVTRRWRRAFIFALCGAAPAVIYAAIARLHGWPLLPSSVLMKQRLLGVHVLTWHGLADVAGGGALTALVHSPALFVLVLAAVAQLASGPAGDADPDERERRLLLAVFAGAALVHVQFGRLGWLYRYEAYLIALGIVANAASLGRWLAAPWPRRPLRQWAALAVLLVLCVQPLLLRGMMAAREALADIRELYGHEYQLAQLFGRHPIDGALLLGDLGMITYYSDMPIVDTGGLATLELIEQARENRYDRDLVLRVARSHGVRVSIAGNPAAGAESWICVAEWTALAEPHPDPTYFFAADSETAAALERNLHTFVAEGGGRDTRLVFPSATPGLCPGPR